jgi:Ca2+-binding EF-hand superfamily protein
MSKREQQEKELKAVLAKDIGSKNPVFSTESIQELHALFSLYADPRQRRADVREVLLTAGTLGLDSKYEFVFRLLQEINDSTHGAALDFEQFLKELTNRIVLSLPRRETPSAKRADVPTSPSST